MTLQAKRLRWIRESLRRPDGRPVDKVALSRALDWPDHRWKNLEGLLPWGEDSKNYVRAGLIALVARTTLPEDVGQRAVRYVFGETSTKPWTSAPTWREGMCPEGKRVGRPRRGEVVKLDAAPLDVLRRRQLEAVLAAVAGGEVEPAQAVAAIDGLYMVPQYTRDYGESAA